MKITQLLESDTILIDLKADSKSELIEKLVDSLSAKFDSVMMDSILEAVKERENVMSTGVGKGLAIPHAKIEGIEDNHAVFARLKEPVNYGSIDNQPVELVFLLVGGKERASIHIKLLSKISRLMNNDTFRTQLLQANQPNDILQLFAQEENIPA